MGHGQLPQGRLKEGKEPVDRLDATRGEALVDSNHEHPRAQLSLGFRCIRANKDGIYHRAGVCVW